MASPDKFYSLHSIHPQVCERFVSSRFSLPSPIPPAMKPTIFVLSLFVETHHQNRTKTESLHTFEIPLCFWLH
jgi:hypothetical protein